MCSTYVMVWPSPLESERVQVNKNRMTTSCEVLREIRKYRRKLSDSAIHVEYEYTRNLCVKWLASGKAHNAEGKYSHRTTDGKS